MGHTLSLFGRFSLKGTRMVATYRGAESVEGEIPIFVSAFRESQDRESLDFIRSGIGGAGDPPGSWGATCSCATT